MPDSVYAALAASKSVRGAYVAHAYWKLVDLARQTDAQITANITPHHIDTLVWETEPKRGAVATIRRARSLRQLAILAFLDGAVIEKLTAADTTGSAESPSLVDAYREKQKEIMKTIDVSPEDVQMRMQHMRDHGGFTYLQY